MPQRADYMHSYRQSLKHVNVTDTFWKPRMELVCSKMLPYQWKALHDEIPNVEPSGCIRNFCIASGQKTGPFYGCVFQDSDVAKWIEAAAYTLRYHPDAELEKSIDKTIDLICSVQLPDGYLNTYYIIKGLEKRWTDVMRNHELYCLGHMLEGSVAYYEITGKRKLLDAMIRYVDYVDSVFGPEEGKLHAYPGHEIIEMALIRLYAITREPRHLALAKYFVDERGKEPNYFQMQADQLGNDFKWKHSPFGIGYYQADKPVREQEKAEGHAVRAVYLYAGMADVAAETGDEELLSTCRRIWKNIVTRQMYITGSIGASNYGEAFVDDYQLPNDTVYGETCASIGLFFFAYRMLSIERSSAYSDVMERLLYNGVISGMSLDGTRFFYVNPLETHPEACGKDWKYHHVTPTRMGWFKCACCPTNLARILSSLPRYIYTAEQNVYVLC